MMNNAIIFRATLLAEWLGISVVFMSGSAFAATATGNDSASTQAVATPASAASTYQLPTWTTYYATVDAIRADTQKAQAELDNLKIHHQLEQARKGNFPKDGDKSTPNNIPVPNMANLAQQSAPAAARVAQDPIVQTVSMVDDRWTAIVQLSSGARATVHEGDAIRGVGTIAHIALGEVTVKQGGKVTALQFAGDNAPVAAQSSASNAPAAQTSFGGMPMPTPISLR